MQKYKIITGCIVSVLMLATGVSFCQEEVPTGHITGVIYQEDGVTPRRNVTLEFQRVIRSDNNKKIEFEETYLSSTTGGDGIYVRKDLPVGEYMVQLKKGKRTVKLNKVDFFVRIYEDRTIQFSFTLLN